MTADGQNVYGPVPSRRLGRSLGVDLVPFKTCPYDCIYCQLGRTTKHTARRGQYVSAAAVLGAVRRRLAEGARPDYLTVSGSGEPTLHSRLGDVVRELKASSSTPVAVLTSGALLSRPGVRQACAAADVVLPTLTSTEQRLFARIHRPCAGITCRAVLDGLRAFRQEYEGQIWLEVMLLQGINTNRRAIAGLAEAIRSIRPDRVQVNTVVRPPSDPRARPVGPLRIERIRRLLREDAEVIAEYQGPALEGSVKAAVDEVAAMLRRRPCTTQDIARGLNMRPAEVLKLLDALQRGGRVRAVRRGGAVYYRPDAAGADGTPPGEEP